jgi:hypothetical protein
VSPLAQAALDYAARGLPVFPIAPREKKPPLTEHGFQDATCDEAQLRLWWGETPEANVAIPTSGLLVIDADVRAGPDGRSGVEAWAEIRDRHGGHEPTRMQRTGSGGEQTFFRDAERRFRNTTSRLGANIDTRAEGGYVILPPSVHPCGERYAWLSEISAAPVPEWLADLLTPPPPAPIGACSDLPPGAWATEYGEVALTEDVEELRRAPEGTRNDSLNRTAYRFGRLIEAGEIDPGVAEESLVAAAREAGLSEWEARATFRNGVEAGRKAGPAARRPRAETTRGGRTMRNGLRLVATDANGKPCDRSDKSDQTPLRGGFPQGLVASVAFVATLLPPRPAAYHGLAGKIVRALDPHTEADRVAVLVSVLVGFGNACNRGPHAMVGRTRHSTNVQVVAVGDTSKARKGTSWGDVRFLLRYADPDWARERVVNGLVSGEGVIHHVRDPVKKTNDEGVEKTLDAGVKDKRLMCVESEYGRVLTAGGRDGSTLLHVLRQAWDGERLGNLTKKDPATATDAHVAVLGHITLAELQRSLTETDRANGYANRVLWLYVRRSKELPFGGELPVEEAEELGRDLRRALEHARKVGRVEWAESGRAVWERHYSWLSRERPGLTGAILSRAEAQGLRLALIYALLDCSDEIRAEHVEAALALWDYSERSVGLIFDGVLGDPVADAIVAALRRAGTEGCSRTEIRDLFTRHKNADQIERALSLLEREGLAARGKAEAGEAGGRPAELWFAIAATEATEGTEPPTGAPESDDDLERYADRFREETE